MRRLHHLYLFFFVLSLTLVLASVFSGETNKQISELKFKLVKSEQDVATLEQNVSLCFCLIQSQLIDQ